MKNAILVSLVAFSSLAMAAVSVVYGFGKTQNTALTDARKKAEWNCMGFGNVQNRGYSFEAVTGGYKATFRYTCLDRGDGGGNK